jgi:hypothetical protein
MAEGEMVEGVMRWEGVVVTEGVMATGGVST